jgi:serine/threonine protein kinase
MPHGTLDSVLDQFYRGDAPAQWDATARSKAVVGVAAGMAFMHSVGILHGDLSPKTIMLDERYEIRIADFGRRCEGAEVSEARRPDVTWAPEVLESQSYTSRADVYSYGICLYLLFANALFLNDRPTRQVRTLPDLILRVEAGARFVRKGKIPDFYWDLIR